MGRSSPLLRVLDSFSFLSVSFPGSTSTTELFPLLHPGDCSGRCSCRPSGERGYRSSPFLSWLLQSAVRNTQGHWRLASGDRPLLPQPFCGCLPLPNGDDSVGSPISPSGGFASILGPPGCLPPGSGASNFSPFPEVPCRRGGFPVPLSVFRPLESSAGLRPHRGPDLLHHASLWLQDSSLAGRLARPRILVSGDSAVEGLPPLVVSRAGDLHHSSEELSDTVSDHRLSGIETSDVSFEGFPDPQTCPEAPLSRS